MIGNFLKRVIWYLNDKRVVGENFWNCGKNGFIYIVKLLFVWKTKLFL